jgi:predicted AlkP superfamily phosphohydrolase/phosphomutase
MKVLIIGLDGATWDVFDDYVLDNHMPNLKRLKSEGYSGILRSTEPPITAASWTTCLTGCNPSKHGVIGWCEYLFEEDRLRINTSEGRLVPTMWEELSEQGYKIASINVPWTYPCPQVNGILISGYGCPGPGAEIVYPPKFKEELLKHIADYEIMAEWEKRNSYTVDQLDENLRRVERSLEQKIEAAELISEKLPWNVMMVQFHDTDSMEHRIWPYLDIQSRDDFPLQRDRVFKTFEKLDDIMGRLLEIAAAKELSVFVVSDHGLTRQAGKVRPNMMLCEWGYLKPKNVITRMIQRRRRKQLMATIGQKDEVSNEAGIKQPKDYDFDWLGSKAMVIDTAINGHLYVNVKGRQPHGKIEPGAEYDEVVRELTKRFSEVVNPTTGEKVFSKIGTPADVYCLNGDSWRKYGDLVLVPRTGYEIVLSASRRSGLVQMSIRGSLRGHHSYGGIYVFQGDGIKAGVGRKTHIVNIAPTVYAALGAELPSYMDGRVVEEAFVEKKNIKYHQRKIGAISGGGKELSAEEEAEITKRLSALGYLE